MVEEQLAAPRAVFRSHIEVKSTQVAQASVMISPGATPLSIQLDMGTAIAKRFPSKRHVVEQRVELRVYSLLSTEAKTIRSASHIAQEVKGSMRLGATLPAASGDTATASRRFSGSSEMVSAAITIILACLAMLINALSIPTGTVGPPLTQQAAMHCV